jgi:hypothetical protein
MSSRWGWGDVKRDHFTHHRSKTVFWFKNDGPFAGAFLFYNFFIFVCLFIFFSFLSNSQNNTVNEYACTKELKLPVLRLNSWMKYLLCLSELFQISSFQIVCRWYFFHLSVFLKQKSRILSYTHIRLLYYFGYLKEN